MLSHNGYGPRPGPRAQKGAPPAAGPRAFLGPGPEPGPISIMAEHMGIKGKQQAIATQPKKGSIARAIQLIYRALLNTNRVY